MNKTDIPNWAALVGSRHFLLVSVSSAVLSCSGIKTKKERGPLMAKIPSATSKQSPSHRRGLRTCSMERMSNIPTSGSSFKALKYLHPPRERITEDLLEKQAPATDPKTHFPRNINA